MSDLLVELECVSVVETQRLTFLPGVKPIVIWAVKFAVPARKHCAGARSLFRLPSGL